ncbi:GGDEF domain-containing protein [Aliiglaciecola sp. 2_MG-2023]|uniref:GGDEF domain-containing protein n=2 Tax=unclassified Aliiglaciecola TaxID=2593648 RepID=UPI0026E19055|nr:GGDEF domain-containing protein [Aliiglaciecola sp. 1_MG-2023]MDO6709582.1 GGDEF domain-containing protein [Aliiglaciecola sp. 2_MG-2023]MDO6750876.1 GGDEF domain-containing protein [Aliiglaciecola sp. 1_MG-2023]
MTLRSINIPPLLAIMLMFCSFLVRAETAFFFQHADNQTPFSQIHATLVNRIADSATVEEQVKNNFSLASLLLQFDRVELLTEVLDELAELGVGQSNDVNSLKWQIFRGYSYFSLSQYVAADTSFNQAKDILDILNIANKQQPELIYLAAVLTMYSGINDGYLQRYTKATESLSEVNHIANANNWSILSGLSLYYSGDVNYELKNYEQAEVFYRLSKQMFAEHDTIFRAISLMSEGQMINIVGDRKQAFFLLDNAIQVFVKMEDISSLAYAYLLKSYFHSKDGNDTEALRWIGESVTLREELNNPVTIANSYVHYSSILNANGFLDRALSYAEKAALMAAETDDLAGQWDAFNQYARILNEKGEFQKAYDYMYKSERALLAKARLDITSQTARLNSEFNLAQQQLENQFLDEKNELLQTQLEQQTQLQKRQQWIVLGLVVFTVIVMLFLAIIYQLYRKNKRLAILDNLTGLRNRRSILESGEQAFAISKRYKQNLCVLMLDVDNFKLVNDNYGHAEGDKVLKFVASICKEALRASDYVGRIGGEEFLFVLPNSSEKEGNQLAKRLFQNIQEHISQAGLKVGEVTFSLGLAANLEQCNDFLELASLADAALYEAKAKGKNQVQTYTDEMQFKHKVEPTG